MDWANLGLPCLLVRPLTELQFKEGLRIPDSYAGLSISKIFHKIAYFWLFHTFLKIKSILTIVSTKVLQLLL